MLGDMRDLVERYGVQVAAVTDAELGQIVQASL